MRWDSSRKVIFPKVSLFPRQWLVTAPNATTTMSMISSSGRPTSRRARTTKTGPEVAVPVVAASLNSEPKIGAKIWHSLSLSRLGRDDHSLLQYLQQLPRAVDHLPSRRHRSARSLPDLPAVVVARSQQRQLHLPSSLSVRHRRHQDNNRLGHSHNSNGNNSVPHRQQMHSPQEAAADNQLVLVILLTFPPETIPPRHVAVPPDSLLLPSASPLHEDSHHQRLHSVKLRRHHVRQLGLHLRRVCHGSARSSPIRDQLYPHDLRQQPPLEYSPHLEHSPHLGQHSPSRTLPDQLCQSHPHLSLLCPSQLWRL